MSENAAAEVNLSVCFGGKCYSKWAHLYKAVNRKENQAKSVTSQSNGCVCKRDSLLACVCVCKQGDTLCECVCVCVALSPSPLSSTDRWLINIKQSLLSQTPESDGKSSICLPAGTERDGERPHWVSDIGRWGGIWGREAWRGRWGGAEGSLTQQGNEMGGEERDIRQVEAKWVMSEPGEAVVHKPSLESSNCVEHLVLVK